MNPLQKHLTILLIITSTCLSAAPADSDDIDKKAIGRWVARQKSHTEPFELPTIHFVDKTDLGIAFTEGNENAYYRWEKQYGQTEAQKILSEYLDNIVGLFNEKSYTIYIGTFMSECSQRAVLAHEMVHYFQHLKEGVIPAGTYQEGIMRLKREMEAYQIEKEYRQTFCSDEESLSNIKKSIDASDASGKNQ